MLKDETFQEDNEETRARYRKILKKIMKKPERGINRC